MLASMIASTERTKSTRDERQWAERNESQQSGILTKGKYALRAKGKTVGERGEAWTHGPSGSDERRLYKRKCLEIITNMQPHRRYVRLRAYTADNGLDVAPHARKLRDHERFQALHHVFGEVVGAYF